MSDEETHTDFQGIADKRLSLCETVQIFTVFELVPATFLRMSLQGLLIDKE